MIYIKIHFFTSFDPIKRKGRPTAYFVKHGYTQYRLPQNIPDDRAYFITLCERSRLLQGNRLLSKNHGAADRDRTGTVFPPRDFKSLASANSATAADGNCLYDSGKNSRCQDKSPFNPFPGGYSLIIGVPVRADFHEIIR